MRQPGFYWVSRHGASGDILARWTGQHWELPRDDRRYADDELGNIAKVPIEPPGESPVMISVELDVWQTALALLKEMAEDMRAEIVAKHFCLQWSPAAERAQKRDLEPVERAEVFIAKHLPAAQR